MTNIVQLSISFTIINALVLHASCYMSSVTFHLLHEFNNRNYMHCPRIQWYVCLMFASTLSFRLVISTSMDELRTFFWYIDLSFIAETFLFWEISEHKALVEDKFKTSFQHLTYRLSAIPTLVCLQIYYNIMHLNTCMSNFKKISFFCFT